MWVFDRQRPEHPWRNALAELRDSQDRSQAALAQNWQMDHRVTESREERLNASGEFGEVPNGGRWHEGVRRYFDRHLCASWEGHPSNHASNQVNRLHTSVVDFDELVHIKGLRTTLRLIFRLGRAQGSFLDSFLELTGHEFPSPIDSPQIDAIAISLQRLGAEAIKVFAGLLIDILGETQPPWWASFGEELASLLENRQGTELANALGIGHLGPRDWLLVWRYAVREVGTLYGPTVIEARDSAFHFPSPPDHSFGICMPLARDLPMCAEVVHRPLPPELAQESCTGNLLLCDEEEEETSRMYNGLEQCRSEHAVRLRTEFTSETQRSWMDRHNSS